MSEKKLRTTLLLAVLAVTALVHLRCLFLDFNSFWDHIYVFSNPFQTPITLKLVGRAFTSTIEGNYHPLTLISHSLDVTFWGARPFGHHLSSYLLHLANVLLVFSILERLLLVAKKEAGRSVLFVAGLTALLFGVHPLRVESVAWVTERKDVLFVFFYLLSLLLYLEWRRAPRTGPYLLALFAYLFSALSKPMAVSLPIVLLVLDAYPLRLFRKGRRWKTVAEKVPFLLVALFAGVMVLRAHARYGMLHPLRAADIARSVIEYPAVLGFYVWKTLWPFRLAPIYPAEVTAAEPLLTLSWALFASVLFLALLQRRRLPSLLAGLLLYMALLLPTSGLVRFGGVVVMARYAYLTTIPLFAGLAWLLLRVLRKQYFGEFAGVVFACWAAFLCWKTVSYTGLWEKPIALTRLAYTLYPESGVTRTLMVRSYNNAALRLAAGGRFGEALECCRKALEVDPRSRDAYVNLGTLHLRAGNAEEGIDCFRRAIGVAPRDAVSFFLLGLAYGRTGRQEEALAAFRRAIEINPSNAQAHHNLAWLYARGGDFEKAAGHCRRARGLGIPVDPDLLRELEPYMKR